jgi:hypothetical protein
MSACVVNNCMLYVLCVMQCVIHVLLVCIDKDVLCSVILCVFLLVLDDTCIIDVVLVVNLVLCNDVLFMYDLSS